MMGKGRDVRQRDREIRGWSVGCVGFFIYSLIPFIVVGLVEGRKGTQALALASTYTTLAVAFSFLLFLLVTLLWEILEHNKLMPMLRVARKVEATKEEERVLDLV